MGFPSYTTVALEVPLEIEPFPVVTLAVTVRLPSLFLAQLLALPFPILYETESA